MSFTEQLEALERLHLLIKRKATGTPEELSQMFNVSYSTIKNMLRILKQKGFPFPIAVVITRIIMIMK